MEKASATEKNKEYDIVLEMTMKHKLLAVRENLPCDINIGDYIQALASAQFIAHKDGWVERELLKEYSGDPCKVIMNAWYMHNPEQWPPSPDIDPLFVAMHINSMVRERFLQDDSLAYLKGHEPIGCRDKYTAENLCKKGIKAYFSGCMTLTLGYKYKTSKCSGKTYIVDPFFKIKKRPFSWKLQAACAFLRYPVMSLRIREKRKIKYPLSIGQLLDAAWFVKRYSEVFSRDFLLDSEYISQEEPEFKQKTTNNDELLEWAEVLVKKYAEASLVVTSRIHCALPCTALDVPVIYIEDKNLPENSRCRLGGLRELFNIVLFDETKLIPQFAVKGKISKSNYPAIKLDYRPIAESLIERCRAFFSND